MASITNLCDSSDDGRSVIDVTGESDGEECPAPRVSDDGGAVDLTNSDDETPAVRGVAATPSNGARAWLNAV